MDKQDKDGEISRKYHGQLIELHADFARDKLLPFLKRSDHYPIQEALNICQERKLFPEMVYLLARMGNSKEALVLMTEKLGDIRQATEFCKEQDDLELWEVSEHGSVKLKKPLQSLRLEFIRQIHI